jgi:16S rRNA (uracil1498-N3)-methyltransferase
MHFFFCPENFETGKNLLLSEEESGHATKVLRLTRDQTIFILNGMGQCAEAGITNLKGRQVEADIKNIHSEMRTSHAISIALGILKKRDRLEWFIEKAVELGAHEIILFNAAHTEKTRIDEKRLYKIAVSALKQSGNLWLPEIKTGLSYEELIKAPHSGQRFIAHCEDAHKDLLKHVYAAGTDAIILIGPEGDFSGAEIKMALDHHYIPVSLGKLRLRSETAALTALTIFSILNQ